MWNVPELTLLKSLCERRPQFLNAARLEVIRRASEEAVIDVCKGTTDRNCSRNWAPLTLDRQQQQDRARH